MQQRKGWPEWLGFCLGMLVWAFVLTYLYLLGTLLWNSLWPVAGLPPGA